MNCNNDGYRTITFSEGNVFYERPTIPHYGLIHKDWENCSGEYVVKLKCETIQVDNSDGYHKNNIDLKQYFPNNGIFNVVSFELISSKDFKRLDDFLELYGGLVSKIGRVVMENGIFKQMYVTVNMFEEICRQSARQYAYFVYKGRHCILNMKYVLEDYKDRIDNRIYYEFMLEISKREEAEKAAKKAELRKALKDVKDLCHIS